MPKATDETVRRIYQCPDCHTYLSDYNAGVVFAMCRTCWHTWDLADLKVISIRDYPRA